MINELPEKVKAYVLMDFSVQYYMMQKHCAHACVHVHVHVQVREKGGRLKRGERGESAYSLIGGISCALY